MSPATWRLVLLVSAAHALVHILELALPSAEVRMALDYGFDKDVSGWLAFSWRMPWGLAAIAAGWLTDHWGADRTLAIFLVGCSLMCAIVGCYVALPVLFLVMVAMGTLASIYHPAGLALISHKTTPSDRPRALGIHGVFGSLGIGGAPLLAAMVFSFGLSWRSYYWLLSILSLLLGLAFVARWRRQSIGKQFDAKINEREDANVNWTSFRLICVYSFVQGFAYAAMMSFLPRYLERADVEIPLIGSQSTATFLAGCVLLIGCVGQYVSGRIAAPRIMERQLSVISILAAVPLAWMAVAAGGQRIAATALYALLMFMLQPIYNSLVAKYTPARRRSLCYGLTFAIGLGVGSLGSLFVGYSESDLDTYGTLSALAIFQGGIGWILWLRHRPQQAV